MKKLMTHIVAGYPTMSECEEIAVTMAKEGVGFIEIQIPFSDPVADGATIMAANQAALDSGVRTKDCFELMERLKGKFGEIDEGAIQTPLLFMSYYNVLFKYGVEEFCRKAADVGAWGLIVPDLPFDEEDGRKYLKACKDNGLKAIQVVAPNTGDERLRQISEVADGFVYCVARTGITGSKTELGSEFGEYLEKVRSYIDLPLAVGFGISSPEQVHEVWEHAEIAVVGSKMIKEYSQHGIAGVEKFLKAL